MSESQKGGQAPLGDVRDALEGISEQDQPVLFRVMQEILAEGDGAGEGAFADAFRSGSSGGRFSSHWSHSSGLVSDDGSEPEHAPDKPTEE